MLLASKNSCPHHCCPLHQPMVCFGGRGCTSGLPSYVMELMGHVYHWEQNATKGKKPAFTSPRPTRSPLACEVPRAHGSGKYGGWWRERKA